MFVCVVDLLLVDWPQVQTAASVFLVFSLGFIVYGLVFILVSEIVTKL
jgi:hypothetical protein